MIRIFYDDDADLGELTDETVGVLGYGIQGRAQALNLRDSGVNVVVGNREDSYRRQAIEDGFEVLDLAQAAQRSSLILFLLPDEIQPAVYAQLLAPNLNPGDGLVLAHGFSYHYGLIDPAPEIDILLLAPRMPGQYVRERYLEGWGVPAFVSVERNPSGRGWVRLLALARGLGATRCGAFEVDAAQETQLDHFSEHFTYPLIFRALELAFEELVQAGFPPEIALMELHGSEELGAVLGAAAQVGLYRMIESHASPACQVGMAHHWEQAAGTTEALRERIRVVLEQIRNGRFARHLMKQASKGYPELAQWKNRHSRQLIQAEQNLQQWLKRPHT